MTADHRRFEAAERALWARYRIEPQERWVELPAGNRVRLQEVADGDPILFLHGAAVAGSSRVALADALRAEFRCILVDRPGCGLSDPVPGGPLTSPAATKRFADQLVPTILDGLGLQAAPLMCTSLGGFFGFRAAVAAPERVSKLVEYSWPMGTPMATVPTMMRFGSLGPMKALMTRLPITEGAVRMMLKQVGLGRAIESGQFDQHMLAWTVSLLRDTDTFRSETDNNTFITLRGQRPELLVTDEELDRLNLPVLLLWGDEDPNGGRAEAEALAARLPDATLDVVERAGHAPWIDELDRCAASTRAFLSGPL